MIFSDKQMLVMGVLVIGGAWYAKKKVDDATDEIGRRIDTVIHEDTFDLTSQRNFINQGFLAVPRLITGDYAWDWYMLFEDDEK